MDITCEVNTSMFEAMCDELAHYCNVPDDTILREEVGHVLTQALDNTRAADASEIRNKSDNAAYSELPTTLYTPKHPQRRHLSKSGRVKYNLSHRYPDVLWQRIQKARAVDVAKKLAARGLAKQSWLKLGEMLGLSVIAPSYVKRAIATTGKEYPSDEQVQILREEGALEYDLQNSQPTVNAIGGEHALQEAIDGRVQYFINNWGRGVFNGLAAIAKKYPGVEIQGNQ